MSVLLPRLILLLFCFFIHACGNEPQLKHLNKDAIILAFGDSLTYGTGVNQTQSYPAQLERLINRKVINSGVPGEISARGLHRLPKLLNKHQPNLVILCHGANDILRRLDLTQAKSNLQKMIDLIQQSGSEVIILAVPEFSLFLSPAALYGELADTNNVAILEDTLSDILLNPAYKSDQIHPNADGYLIVATKIKALLIKNGGLRQSSNSL